MPKSTNQREKILKTALELFALHSYQGTSISLIAAEAKISQGLLYNFFSRKEDVLKELISIAFQDIKKSMASYENQTDPRKAIEVHIRTTCTIIKERSHFWRMIHAIRLQQGVPGVMVAGYHDIIAKVTSIFEGVFKKLGYADPKLEALLFLSQIDGLVILYLQDDHTPLDKLANHLIKRYNP